MGWILVVVVLWLVDYVVGLVVLFLGIGFVELVLWVGDEVGCLVL